MPWHWSAPREVKRKCILVSLMTIRMFNFIDYFLPLEMTIFNYPCSIYISMETKQYFFFFVWHRASMKIRNLLHKWSYIMRAYQLSNLKRIGIALPLPIEQNSKTLMDAGWSQCCKSRCWCYMVQKTWSFLKHAQHQETIFYPQFLFNSVLIDLWFILFHLES